MITEEKLAIIKDEYITHDVMEDCVICKDVPEMLDTLSALWRVAKAAEKYEFRTRMQDENENEDPRFSLYARMDLFKALTALREGKETRNES